MTPEHRFGKTTTAPVNVLPELPVDFLEGRPLPEGLGKTETPVNALPELTFDMTNAVPALQIVLRLRPDAPSTEAALDLFQLCAVVNRLELGDGGSGLAPEASGWDRDGKLRILFKPTNPTGATERLTKLAAGICNGAGPTYRCLEVCVATVIQVAA